MSEEKEKKEIDEYEEKESSKTSENLPERDEHGRLLPGGKSLNPNGRPKFSLVAILKDLLKEVPEGDKESVAMMLMRKAIERAKKGDSYLMRDIINRIDGMPKQTMGFDLEDMITELNITVKSKKDESKLGSDTSVPEESSSVSAEEE